MALTIDDLLNALQNPTISANDPKLVNTRETWSRIGARDSFSELGLEGSELDSFLEEWIAHNPYENLA